MGSRGQNRKQADRAKHDQYWTPPELAEKLVDLLPIQGNESGIDFQAGGGAFVRALKRKCAWVGAVDIDPTVPGLHDADAHWVADSRTWGWPYSPGMGPAWAVGNTPYKDIVQYLEASFRHCQHSAYLLPLALQESKGRIEFWVKYKKHLRGYWALAERVPFERTSMSGEAIGSQQGLFGSPGREVEKDGDSNNTALAFYWFDMKWEGRAPEEFHLSYSWIDTPACSR